MPVSSQGAVDLGVNMESWLVRFDNDGHCISPKTQAALLDRPSVESERPVILFSHGWNNDFDDATALYRDFLRQSELHLTAQHSGFKPLFVGVLWPSIRLSFDMGMHIAGPADTKAAAAEAKYMTELGAAHRCRASCWAPASRCAPLSAMSSRRSTGRCASRRRNRCLPGLCKLHCTTTSTRTNARRFHGRCASCTSPRGCFMANSRKP